MRYRHKTATEVEIEHARSGNPENSKPVRFTIWQPHRVQITLDREEAVHVLAALKLFVAAPGSMSQQPDLTEKLYDRSMRAEGWEPQP